MTASLFISVNPALRSLVIVHRARKISTKLQLQPGGYSTGAEARSAKPAPWPPPTLFPRLLYPETVIGIGQVDGNMVVGGTQPLCVAGWQAASHATEHP